MWFGNKLQRRSGGLIKMEYAWASSLTNAGEELQLLKAGLAQFMTVTTTIFTSELFLNTYGIALPFGPDDMRVQRCRSRSKPATFSGKAATLGRGSGATPGLIKFSSSYERKFGMKQAS